MKDTDVLLLGGPFHNHELTVPDFDHSHRIYFRPVSLNGGITYILTYTCARPHKIFNERGQVVLFFSKFRQDFQSLLI